MKTRESHCSKGNTDFSVLLSEGRNSQVPPIHTVQGSARDVSILYSAGNLLVNTREHFSAKREEMEVWMYFIIWKIVVICSYIKN